MRALRWGAGRHSINPAEKKAGTTDDTNDTDKRRDTGQPCTAPMPFCPYNSYPCYPCDPWLKLFPGGFLCRGAAARVATARANYNWCAGATLGTAVVPGRGGERHGDPGRVPVR